MRAFRTAKRLQLFLHDLGVLDHGDPTALGQFARQCDRFAAVLSELIVHRLVFADDQICFAVAEYPDRTAALDALISAGLPVFLADAIVIDVAHHIDHFACHLFGSGCITGVIVFFRDRESRECQTRNEDRSHRNSQNGRFICGIKHDSNVSRSAHCVNAASGALFNQLRELIEKIGGVMRPWRGFGMILHTEDWQFLVTHSLNGAVVQVDVGHFNR